jgi:hypothetical protein
VFLHEHAISGRLDQIPSIRALRSARLLTFHGDHIPYSRAHHSIGFPFESISWRNQDWCLLFDEIGIDEVSCRQPSSKSLPPVGQQEHQGGD